MGQLSRDTSHRQAEPHVRRHGHVEHGVAEADDGPGVLTDLTAAGGENDDAVVVLAEPELALGADHAVGHVAVGLARGDLESSCEDRAWQRDDHEITFGEIARSADDSAHARSLGVAVSGTHLHLTPADRLLELRELVDRTHETDDERAGDIGAEVFDLLELESDGDQPLTDCLGRLVRGDIDVVPQPGQWDAHQTSMPNCVVKRMSPSTISRMSVTSCRNISVRSIPMPNANPE